MMKHTIEMGRRKGYLTRSSKPSVAIMFLLFIVCLSNLSTLSAKEMKGFAGWVDPDTSTKHHKIKSLSRPDANAYDIVMSDEFNREGREFIDGADPMWTGVDRSDDDQTSSGRKSLQFYNSSNVRTSRGHLIITTTTEDTKWKGWNPYLKKYQTMQRHFRSGMVQTWNKFCYTGGILEISVKFPGNPNIGGLWPAVWLLGNLGRATFEGSTNRMWPWSYEKCNRDLQRAQEISGCDVTSHYNMQPGHGRGATEIDLIEVMAGPSTKLPLVKNNVKRPYCSMTLQLAPGVPASKKRPYAGTLPEWGFNWYKNISYGPNTSINPFFYGTYLAPTKSQEPVSRSIKESYQCDAISSMVQLTSDHWENFHKFRLEWQPGPQGYVHWYMDDEYVYGIEAEGLDIFDQGVLIPQEPSYVIINTAISTSWGFPNPQPGCRDIYDCKDPLYGQCNMNPGFCGTLPANFSIDYIRIYQNKEDKSQTVGCNPPDYPTKRFINAHAYRYKGDEQKVPLKDVIKGGGKCVHDTQCSGLAYVSDGDEGGHAVHERSDTASKGEYNGYCKYKKCHCYNGWTGPHCKVPDYKNDFPDWDVDGIAAFHLPYIPSFLLYSVVFFLIAVGITAICVFRRGERYTMYITPDEKDGNSWL